MIKVTVSTVVNPTESKDKVYSALSQIFPEMDFDYEELPEQRGKFTGENDIHSLKNIHYQIREEEIIDTSRTRLNVGLSEDGLETSFIISKQVATVGRLNYPAQAEPLGSIDVTIESDDEAELQRFFDWLTPPTEDGVPDFEMDIRDV